MNPSIHWLLERPPFRKVGTYDGVIHEMIEADVIPFGLYSHNNQPLDWKDQDLSKSKRFNQATWFCVSSIVENGKHSSNTTHQAHTPSFTDGFLAKRPYKPG